MSWGVLNAAMLVGLAGVALPVIIHLLNKRRDTVIEWGAMQFLELGKQARRKIRLSEMLLMLARMGLLAMAALALARPFLAPSTRAAEPAVLAPPGRRRPAAGRRAGDRRLGQHGAPPRRHDPACPGHRVGAAIRAAVRARRRRSPCCWPARASAGWSTRRASTRPGWTRPWRPSRPPGGSGSSDLPAAMVEAFRILEHTQNPDRLVIVLTDGQRYAWRPGETGRWSLVRELHRRLPVPPAIWSVALASRRPVRAGQRLGRPAEPLATGPDARPAGPR